MVDAFTRNVADKFCWEYLTQICSMHGKENVAKKIKICCTHAQKSWTIKLMLIKHDLLFVCLTFQPWNQLYSFIQHEFPTLSNIFHSCDDKAPKVIDRFEKVCAQNYYWNTKSLKINCLSRLTSIQKGFNIQTEVPFAENFNFSVWPEEVEI